MTARTIHEGPLVRLRHYPRHALLTWTDREGVLRMYRGERAQDIVEGYLRLAIALDNHDLVDQALASIRFDKPPAVTFEMTAAGALSLGD